MTFDIGTLQPGEMRRVPGTALRAARQSDGARVIEWMAHPVTGADQAWPADAGNLRDLSIMRAESGAAVDIARRGVYVCGGGHYDGAHFGVYGFKYRLPGDPIAADQWKWRRAIRHPQLFNGANNWPPISTNSGTSVNPDGSPVSRHTWSGIFFLPNRKRLFVSLGSTWPLGWGDPQSLSWLGDCVGGFWEKGYPFINTRVEAMIGAAFDPPNKILWTTGGAVREHNLDTGQNKRLNGQGDPISTMGQCVLDAKNRKLYLTLSYNADKYLRRFDLDKPGSVTELLHPTGDTTALYTYRVWQWFSDRYGLVQWIGGNDLYVARLPDINFTKFTLTGDTGPARVTQGGFGKFNKLTEDGEFFIILTEVSNDAYVGRMPSTGDDMATPETVLAKSVDAVNEAYSLAGQASMPDQIAALQAQVATLTADNAALQTKLDSALVLVDDAIAADTVADQQEAARLQAARDALV